VREKEERFDETGVSVLVKIPIGAIPQLESLLRDATRDDFRLSIV
jgi:hypothetical protein